MQRTNPVRALQSTKKYYTNALQTGGRPFTGTSLPEKRAATTGVSKAVKARRIIDDEEDTTNVLALPSPKRHLIVRTPTGRAFGRPKKFQTPASTDASMSSSFVLHLRDSGPTQGGSDHVLGLGFGLTQLGIRLGSVRPAGSGQSV